MSDIVMPQLGETVTEGTITRWLKAVGEPVAQDEPLFEVSTDKVDSEVPSSASGVLAEILVTEGETVPVGARLAVVSASAGRSEADGSGAAVSEPPAAPMPAAQAPAAPMPAAQAPAAPMPAAQAPAAASAVPEAASGLILSPVVRRLIAEHELDASQIVGTGPGGRITRDDVLGVIEGRARDVPRPRDGSAAESAVFAAPATRAEGILPAPSSPAPRGPDGASTFLSRPGEAGPGEAGTSRTARSGDEIVPFTNIRRRTAEHMVRSKHTSAHTLAVMEVDFEAVEAVRRAHGSAFAAEEGFSLTYLPFLIVATVEAIRAWPHINASVGDDAVIVHHDIHIGVAVDLEAEGLIVPVIHNADAKRLRALAREVRELATRARTKKLTADDIAGGTFTITNPGPFGTLLTAPIINQPQVAILSTDGVKRRPVVIETAEGGEAITVHSVGNLALSFDHRVIDGAYASRFLRTMKEIVEGRDWAQEL